MSTPWQSLLQKSSTSVEQHGRVLVVLGSATDNFLSTFAGYDADVLRGAADIGCSHFDAVVRDDGMSECVGHVSVLHVTHPRQMLSLQRLVDSSQLEHVAFVMCVDVGDKSGDSDENCVAQIRRWSSEIARFLASICGSDDSHKKRHGERLRQVQRLLLGTDVLGSSGNSQSVDGATDGATADTHGVTDIDSTDINCLGVELVVLPANASALLDAHSQTVRADALEALRYFLRRECLRMSASLLVPPVRQTAYELLYRYLVWRLFPRHANFEQLASGELLVAGADSEAVLRDTCRRPVQDSNGPLGAGSVALRAFEQRDIEGEELEQQEQDDAAYADVFPDRPGVAVSVNEDGVALALYLSLTPYLTAVFSLSLSVLLYSLPPPRVETVSAVADARFLQRLHKDLDSVDSVSTATAFAQRSQSTAAASMAHKALKQTAQQVSEQHKQKQKVKKAKSMSAAGNPQAAVQHFFQSLISTHRTNAGGGGNATSGASGASSHVAK